MSLRARLLVGAGLIVLVLVLAVGVTLHLTRSHLLDQVDGDLRAAVANPAREVFGRDTPTPGRGPAGYGPTPFYVAVVRAGAFVLEARPDVAEDPPSPPALTVGEVVAGAQRGTAFTVDAREGDARYRAVATGLGGPGPGQDAVLVLALPLDAVDATVRRLTVVLVGAAVAVAVVLAAVVWWVLHLGIRPIKAMTATATAIAGGDLGRRVPAGRPGTEAGELGTALNRMLGAIEGSLDARRRSEERLRQFVADASHELRTPVTTIRGYAELYRAGGLAGGGDLDEAMRRTEQEAVRMGRLVEDMLQLARLDQGRPLARGPVDLAAVAADAARDAAAVDPDRPVSATADGPVVVEADEDRLRQVVANLVGNALVHTPARTAVELRVGGDATTAWLEVADHGPGMAPEVAARAFERFYRADPSRSRHRGGSGLGLAIVDAVVGAHGGTVELDTAEGRGTTVRVALPRTVNPGAAPS